jgi:N-methylhydantoinase A
MTGDGKEEGLGDTMSLFVGSDIGGTFTDVVGFDPVLKKLTFGKTLTNRGDLVEGVLSALADIEITPPHIAVLKHGTTQVINVLLERAGANMALVVTKGFGDLMEINRAGRAVTFDISYRRAPSLVARENCLEIEERIASDGSVITKLNHAALEELAAKIEAGGYEAVAVSLVNSYRNSAHEDEITAFLQQRFPTLYITSGTSLSREWYEYERTSTAVANAYVGPRAVTYVDRFEKRLEQAKFPGLFYMVGSNGGVLRVDRAKEQPISLVESGPIGGCVGATVFARHLGLERVIAFDMGGTTAKCALVENSRFDVLQTYYVGGYEYGFPVRTPVLDIVEVGTGGGSIAEVDAHGRLRVGPKSAGSDPGPVCFGQGGDKPTVTDANLVLNRIGGSTFLSGRLKLDRDAAAAALLDSVGARLNYQGGIDVDRVADGIVALANVQMSAAIKEITVERGRDVRDFDLFVFGGGGPLHGIDLARELRIPRVIVPPEPGNFSALGMLFADARVEMSVTRLIDLATGDDAALAAPFVDIQADIERAIARDFGASPSTMFEYQADIRFKGQRHALRIDIEPSGGIASARRRFLAKYIQRYGYADESGPIEVIGLRTVGVVVAERPDIRRLHSAATSGTPVATRRSVFFRSAGQRLDTPVYRRSDLPVGFAFTGPAIIEEYGSTTIIGPGDGVLIGDLGEIQVTLAKG